MFTPGRAKKQTPSRVRGESYGGEIVGTPTSVPSSVAASRPSLSPWPSPAPTANVPRTNIVNRTGDKGGGIDGNQPVFVCDLPQQLRALHSDSALSSQPDGAGLQGGMDGRSGLSWVLQGNQLYVWSHLRSRSCVLNMPRLGRLNKDDTWLVSLVPHQLDEDVESSYIKGCDSVSVVMCSSKTLAVVYWPDAFSNGDKEALTSMESEDTATASPLNEEKRISRRLSGWTGATGTPIVTSIQATATGTPGNCVAIVGRSDGELWRFNCTAENISRESIVREVTVAEVGYSIFVADSSSARSIVWLGPAQGASREFLLLTAQSIECWEVELTPNGKVSKVWTYEISNDKDVMYDLSGQKQVWLLDLQLDESGKEFTMLVASFSKDRITSSSYMQYVLHYFSHYSKGEVKRKAPPQVILPKARVEEESFLYSMRLRVGGQPAGSALILAADGTATIAHVGHGGNVRLYKFELAWGAGKVLDACVIPADEPGAWLVLTEQAGVWAIPAKAVLTGGVEPPERSLSRRGSNNEETSKENRTQMAVDEDLALERTSSEPGETSMHLAVVPHPSQDEEAEAIVGRLFQQFLSSGHANSALNKLQRAGAFERDGDRNVFARTSRALVDTFAKHWASGGGSGLAVIATVSSQLAEKQRRHQQYLNFLAATKCHEELQNNQRAALNEIMEHGEKLAGMVALRELNNSRAQASPTSPTLIQYNPGELSGAQWDMVQLVGDKARRNNVVLMDRDKVEVFYTRVSELEELFACIQQHAAVLVQRDQSVRIQIERACELASVCSTVLQVAISYRDTQQGWYPSPEGLTPWFCKQTVRAGVWKVATMLLELKVEANMSEPTLTEEVMRQVEEMADLLLESYAGAITAKVEREEEYRGLQMEYWTRRDFLLSSLQQHAYEVAGQNIRRGDGAERQRLSVLQKLYAPLIALARRHAAFPSLLQMCRDLDDEKRLRNLMKESMGLKEGRFSRFVFDRHYQEGQFACLLRFGEDFGEEVASYLEQHPPLLWLHQLHLRRFTRAASTLHALAFSQKSSASLDIRHRRRMLHLAKLSALAGGAAGVEEVYRVEADVDILAVQKLVPFLMYLLDFKPDMHRCEKIQEAAASLGVIGRGVVTPGQLVEACLNSGNRDLILGAFQVFTSAGSKFCSGNHSLLEEAWLRAVDQDDWLDMKRTSEEEGWTEEHVMQVLHESLLYQVSRHCYQESRRLYMSLDQEVADRNVSTFAKDFSPDEVEGVIAKHPNFSEAGHAMLTAFRLGFGVESGPLEKEIEEMVEV